MAYIRKTCAQCHKPSHSDQFEGAKCLFDHHVSQPEGTVDHALRCVHLIYGENMRNRIDNLNRRQIAHYFL